MNVAPEKRIAVVGAGLIGRKHIEVVNRRANLCAIIDPDPDAEQLAARLGAYWFGELGEYLKYQKPDGAIIASPNALHRSHGTSCLEAGVPTLIEKPLADTQSNARALAQLAEKAKVPILVGHHRRHSPLVQTAKAAIDDGKLGQIATVNAQFWLYKPDDYFNATWRTQKGAGPIYINLIHDIDLLRHFCGEIIAVQAMESSAIRHHSVEDTAAVLLEFESGILGTVSISDTVVAPWSWELTAGENPAYPKTPMACYTIGGTQASLSVPDLRMWEHTGEKSWWAPIEDRKLTYAAADPIEMQFKHFLKLIDGEVSPLVSAREGMKNIQVLDAIKQAALLGQKCRVG
ncbi:MAG: Gfo/Idh/MocA family protein [Rhizobiaceae bacterium]